MECVFSANATPYYSAHWSAIWLAATDHPYFAAGGLLLLSFNPKLLLTPLRVVERTIISTPFLLCMLAVLPFQLLAIFFLWLLGFRRGGVERGAKDTYAGKR